MTCLRCQHENRPTARFCEDCANPLNAVSSTTVSYAELKTEVEGLKRALIESVEQQTATAEILRVISSSSPDLRPVLDAMAESASRLCAAAAASIFRLDGDVLRVVAHHGPIPHPLGFVLPAVRGTVNVRSVLDRQAIQVADLPEAEEFPEGRAFGSNLGFRTVLSVPLLREGVAIGTIALRRTEVRLFTDKQIALLQTFADQAVIAIENVRLFTELQASNRELTDSLTQQTATAGILRVISSSPTDIQPVLEAVTTSAARLCEAPDAAIFLVDGRQLRLATHLGPVALGPVGEFTVPLVRGSLTGRATLERRTIQLADHQTEEAEYPEGTAVARRLGVQTMLAVPLVRSGESIGVIALRRTEIRLFLDQQIELLKTFADQAVIAIENVRLFTETKEALEQQTATSEILQTISRSPTDVQPVFDTILASALRLMRLHAGTLTRVTGDYLDLAAFKTIDNEGEATLRTRFPQ